VVGRKVDPQGLLLHMLRQLRDAGLQVTAANREFSPGQFEINLAHSGLVDAADRSFRLKSAVQEIARQRDLMATFMAKPRARLGERRDRAERVRRSGGPDGLSAAAGTRSAGCSRTRGR
jgi:hypothetical protein